MNCEHVEDLAFTYWKYHANEKAFAANFITKAMYEFAKESLNKDIDRLSELCYNNAESR